MNPAFDTLVAAERSFAATSVDKGMDGAFFDNLDDDGVVFRPHPVNGTEWYREHPSVNVCLIWEPAIAEASDAGDLGTTTGPWELREKDPQGEVLASGDFFSVWRREVDGPWKLVADIGVRSDTPYVQPSEVKRAGPPYRPNAAASHEGVPALVDFDRAHPGTEPDAAFYTADVRFYRQGFPPATDPGVAASAAEADSGFVRRVKDGGVSADGRLGYTFGAVVHAGAADDAADEAPRGGYLRVWRRGDDGAWKVAADVLLPPRE